MKSLPFFLIVLFWLSGCAVNQNKGMDRDQWIVETHRTYEDVTKEEVLRSVERLFVLADGDDFNFSHSENGIRATRNWMTYMIFAASQGVDTWDVEVKEVGRNTSVQVSAYVSASAIVPVQVGGATSATNTGASGSSINHPSLYRLFWRRLDYLLGKSDHWMGCGEAEKHFSSVDGGPYGISLLCNSFNIKDDSPLTAGN